MEEYVNSEVSEDDEPSQELLAYAQAIVSGQMVYGYPFALIKHRDNTYEVCEMTNIPFDDLIEEYADDFTIRPCYFREDELTPEEARKQGMIALAKELEKNK